MPTDTSAIHSPSRDGEETHPVSTFTESMVQTAAFRYCQVHAGNLPLLPTDVMNRIHMLFFQTTGAVCSLARVYDQHLPRLLQNVAQFFTPLFPLQGYISSASHSQPRSPSSPHRHLSHTIWSWHLFSSSCLWNQDYFQLESHMLAGNLSLS